MGATFTDWTTAKAAAFAYIFLRVAGLMTVGPVFGSPVIPPTARVLLAAAGAFLLAPAVPGLAGAAFIELDANGDGVLTGPEVPAAVAESYEIRGRDVPAGGLTPATFAAGRVPGSAGELFISGVGEFAVGFAVGLGVMAVLAGLRLAGETVDQQSGTALAEAFNPALGGSMTTTGQLLGLVGTAVFLTLPGVDGHLRAYAILLDTFKTLPPGAGWVGGAGAEVLADLAGAGIRLGVTVAAPTVAVMAAISVTVGFLGRTVPQINLLSIGLPLRAAAGLFLLALSLPPAFDVLADTLDVGLTELHAALTGLPTATPAP